MLDKLTMKHTVTMTFEICIIEKMDITGIKLKRIKGDVWVYKEVAFSHVSNI